MDSSLRFCERSVFPPLSSHFANWYNFTLLWFRHQTTCSEKIMTQFSQWFTKIDLVGTSNVEIKYQAHKLLHPSGAGRKLVPCKEKSVEMGPKWNPSLQLSPKDWPVRDDFICSSCTLQDTERCNIASIRCHATSCQRISLWNWSGSYFDIQGRNWSYLVYSAKPLALCRSPARTALI